MTPTYYRPDYLSTLTPSEFANEIKIQLPTPEKSIRNYAGSVLTSLAPSYDEYVARFNDLDAKISLFNQLHHFKIDLGKMENPYYGKETPTEDNGSLCFDGPLEDHHALRCLKIKI